MLMLRPSVAAETVESTLGMAWSWAETVVFIEKRREGWKQEKRTVIIWDYMMVNMEPLWDSIGKVLEIKFGKLGNKIKVQDHHNKI